MRFPASSRESSWHSRTAGTQTGVPPCFSTNRASSRLIRDSSNTTRGDDLTGRLKEQIASRSHRRATSWGVRSARGRDETCATRLRNRPLLPNRSNGGATTTKVTDWERATPEDPNLVRMAVFLEVRLTHALRCGRASPTTSSRNDNCGARGQSDAPSARDALLAYGERGCEPARSRA
jgi:hypothetical protein